MLCITQVQEIQAELAHTEVEAKKLFKNTVQIFKSHSKCWLRVKAECIIGLENDLGQ